MAPMFRTKWLNIQIEVTIDSEKPYLPLSWEPLGYWLPGHAYLLSVFEYLQKGIPVLRKLGLAHAADPA